MSKTNFTTIKVSKKALEKLRLLALVKKPKKQYEVLEDALDESLKNCSEEEKKKLTL